MIGTKVMVVMPPFCIIMDDGTVTQVYYKIQLSFLLDILLEKYQGKILENCVAQRTNTSLMHSIFLSMIIPRTQPLCQQFILHPICDSEGRPKSTT
jgi:hypothetical protein